MINYDRVAEKIFSIIKGHGFNLSMFSEDGMDTSEPADGRRFYVKEPNFMITLDEDNDEIKINKNSKVTLEEIEGILKQMRNLAKQNLLNTQVKVFGKEIAPKDFAYQAKKYRNQDMSEMNEAAGKIYVYHKIKGDRMGGPDYDLLKTYGAGEREKAQKYADAYNKKIHPENRAFHYAVVRARKAPTFESQKYRNKDMSGISEASLSRMHGSKKTSYQTLESVKLIVRHRKAVDEDVRGSRSRQIQAIFLEQAGERFRFPHNSLAGARAMARHMYEGGAMQDQLGEYIIESVGNLQKLVEFIRYTRTNKLINETSEDIIKTIKENIATIRKEFKGLTGAKSYARVSEAIAAREEQVLEEDDITDLQDIFTVRKFDEKIGDMLPLVRKLMNEKQAWRNALIEASEQTILMHEKEELAEEDVMEFENPVQQVGYKIGKVAKRMVETGDLSKFVGKIAGKLIEGETISDFEKTIVRNVLENAKIEESGPCEKCGCYDCTCEVNENTLENITDAFDLKMKMIEHEDIFEVSADYKSERNAKRFANLMLRVAKHIRGESVYYNDPDDEEMHDAGMTEMYEEDAQDYEKIAKLTLAGKFKKATMMWSGLDTASREYPHEVLTDPQLRFFDRFTDAHGAFWSFGTLDEDARWSDDEVGELKQKIDDKQDLKNELRRIRAKGLHKKGSPEFNRIREIKKKLGQKLRGVNEGDYKDCPDCNGGYTQDGKDCKRCEGNGKLWEAGDWDDSVRAGPAGSPLKDCPDCHGRDVNCDRCAGADRWEYRRR